MKTLATKAELKAEQDKIVMFDIAILNIKGSDYSCIISGIGKSEAIKLLQNIDFTEKSGMW